MIRILSLKFLVGEKTMLSPWLCGEPRGGPELPDGRGKGHHS